MSNLSDLCSTLDIISGDTTKKKYEFTEETLERPDGHVLHRIRRLSDGKIGGWIEKEENLSHDGSCWVNDEAQVFDEARISNNAYISGHALIFGEARVYDNAHISGHANVWNNAEIYGDAQISGYALVNDKAVICGKAKVRAHARVGGDARVDGDAQIGDYTYIWYKGQDL